MYIRDFAISSHKTFLTLELVLPLLFCIFGSFSRLFCRAAEQTWKNSLRSIHGVDISEPMLQMARKLLVGICRNADNPIDTIELRRFLSLAAKPRQYDLTVAAFSLGDLPDDGVRKMTVNALWEQTRDILVLIDRGTPEGSRVIANARRQILSQEGYLDENGEAIDGSSRKSELHIVAPCPHEQKCPMVGSWCHFSQRIEVSKFQTETHPIGKGFVDQKFSYLVLRRGSRPALAKDSSLSEKSFHWPRLIRRPLKRQGHIVNDICATDSTFKRLIVPRSQGKQIYYDARKSKWGDLWPHQPKNGYLPINTMEVKPKYLNKTKKDDKK